MQSDIVQRLNDCPDINHARIVPIGRRETEYVVPASVKFALIAEITRLTEALRLQMEAKHKEAAEAKLWFRKAQEWKEALRAAEEREAVLMAGLERIAYRDPWTDPDSPERIARDTLAGAKP